MLFIEPTLRKLLQLSHQPQNKGNYAKSSVMFTQNNKNSYIPLQNNGIYFTYRSHGSK